MYVEQDFYLWNTKQTNNKNVVAAIFVTFYFDSSDLYTSV